MIKFKFLKRSHIALLVICIVLMAVFPERTPALANTTVILVVDDFGGSKTLTPDPTKICVLIFQGQRFATRGGGLGDVTTPHGVLVKAEIDDLIQRYQSSGGLLGNIVSEPLDIQDYGTDNVQTQIQNAISADIAT